MIGHSTRSIDDFVSLLEEHGIKLLADVRSLPGSKRYPQFNKETLAESLTRMEFVTNIFLSWADDENRRLTRATQRGATLHFAVTRITWGRSNFRKVPSVFSLSQARPGLPQSCAQKRCGGVVIVH
jgi:hypothetical protein